MLWKAILILFCMSFIPCNGIIICYYNYDANNLYTCDMLIFNPSGGTVSTISGNHLPNMTDADVVQVIGAGTTPNVPTIICSHFQNLQKLELENLDILSLFNHPFHNCSQLKMLSLRSNILKTLTPILFQKTILEELYLDKNLLQQTASDVLSGLDNLKILSFKGNEQLSLDGSAFEHLTNLEDLNLSGCNFTELKSEWFESGLSQLQILNLAGNLLTEIPADVFARLTGLEILALDFNEITSLNENSISLPALLALFLDSNNLVDFHEKAFGNLPNLEILYLSENNCSSMPSNIFKPLTSLTTLGMHSCDIETINPAWFQSLPNLSILLLEENKIKELPDRAFRSSDHLKFLSIYGNELSELNSRSFSSFSLTHLDVRENRLFGIDHHLMNQSEAIQVAQFSNNICADFDTVEYNLDRGTNMGKLKDCFDNFDKTDFELKTDNSEAFEWYNIRPNEGWSSIEFNVTASESAHIGLTDSLVDSQDALVEIRIGAVNNTLLEFAELGVVKAFFAFSDLLNGNEMRTFRIQWGNRMILVFKNNDIIPFQGYFIGFAFPVNFFGLRTQIPPAGSLNSAPWEVRRLHA